MSKVIQRAWGILAAGALAVGGLPAAAVEASGEPLEARAEDVARQFRPDPGGYDGLFGPEFLNAVPAAQMSAIFTRYHADLGTVSRTRRLGGGDRLHGKFEYAFSKGFAVKASLTIAEASPHRVVGLLIGDPTPLPTSLDAIARGIAALPGQTSFSIARLGARGAELRASHAPDQALAVGSTFKLWILGALLEDITAGKRRWDQVVPLTAAARSLPSGRMHEWPEGAPVTLHTLASMMISESDNTATDQLLMALGRERVEAAMAAMGVRDAARNRPLLTTLEMFKIKAGPDARAHEAWARLDEAGKRKHLRTIAAMPRDAVNDWSSPRGIDTLEWFASAADLTRMLLWLRDHTQAGEAAKGRGVLAINPGVPLDKRAWPYVGYKGGSEPGVLAAAFLLRAPDGAWWTITGAWNNPQADVEAARFFDLLERAADLAANGH